MEKVYLVSANFIRSLTNISNSTQDKFLASAIRETQDIDLTEVLGSKLVKRLCDLVSSGEIVEVENKDYKELLDNTQYFMAYSTVSKLCLITTVKIDNIGVNTTADEKVNPLTLADVFKIENYYTNKADYYKKRLQDYLLANKDKYIELKGCSKYEVNPTLHSAASSPIFLGGARGRKIRY